MNTKKQAIISSVYCHETSTGKLDDMITLNAIGSTKITHYYLQSVLKTIKIFQGLVQTMGAGAVLQEC